MFGRKKAPPPTPVESQAAEAQPRFAPRSPSEAIKPMAAPPPPPRVRKPRGGLLSAISGLMTLFVILAGTALFGLSLLYREVASPGPLQADKVVQIPRNSGTSEIAALLAREGVIERPLLFEVFALVNRQRGSLKAGEFLFKAGTSVSDAIDTLVQGKAILHSVTIPEGLTSEQIIARLAENEILSGEVAEIPREGTLLPDTYKFERGTTRQQIINTMQAAHRQVLNQVWSRRSPDLPIKTPQELVILASIVEKETGRADERTRVAGVFINRLTKRMRLQSDPTIVYGLVGGKGTLGRGILRSEIEKPTPYNTYTVEGLPPGPIANPGRAALEAVANPSRTKDLYFVADGTGGHAFAETLDQHNRNVARWRQVERSRAEDAVVDRVEPQAADMPATPANASAFAPDQPPAAAGPTAAPG
ncbi:MAG: endolytic transglycosylase MltG, partial [Pseudomonadota bacterium]|nr:endolytic transglycosylase MltG [Pseudomonadota bacterium]